MIDCTPESLMREVSCLRCVPSGMMESVRTLLMCDWLSEEQGTVCTGICWEPETEQVSWSEDGGATFQTGDLAFFKANAVEANVTHLDFATPAAAITSLTGLSTDPSLAKIFVDGTLITTLDCSNCLALTDIMATACPNLTTLTLTNCANLQVVTCTGSSNLTTVVDIADIALAAGVSLDSCNLTGTLDIDGSGISVLVVDINPNLTAITTTPIGCANLVSLACDTCDISVLDLSLCPGLGTLVAPNQVNLLDTLILPATPTLFSVLCDSNNLLTLTVPAASNGMDALGANNNALTTVDIGQSTAYTNVSLFNNALPTAQVDAVYAALNTFSLGNAGNVDITGGTNGAPTGGCANADIVSLITVGLWTVAGCP